MTTVLPSLLSLLSLFLLLAQASPRADYDDDFEYLFDSILTEEEDNRRSADDYLCVEHDQVRDQYWALKWADKFKEENLSAWGIVDETKYCSGNGVDHLSCDTAENVELRHGLLVLSAQNQSYYSHRFTGGQTSTLASYAFDRIEIRAALPLGSHLHTSMFAYNPASNSGSSATPTKKRKPGSRSSYRSIYRHRHPWSMNVDYVKSDIDYIEVASNVQRPAIRHGLQIAGGSNIKRDHESGDLNVFHTYGMLWNKSEAQFSFDGNFSKPVYHNRKEDAEYEIALLIGVGGSQFEDQVPENTDLLGWICPALMVDYVRLYDRVSEKFARKLEACQFGEEADDSLIERVCVETRELSRPKTDETSQSSSQESTVSHSSVETNQKDQNASGTAAKPEAIAAPNLTSEPPSYGTLLFVFLIALLCTVPVVILVLVKLGFLENPVPRMAAHYRRDEPILEAERQGNGHSNAMERGHVNTAVHSLEDF